MLRKGYDLYLRLFDLKQIWTPETMDYETAKGWRWFIDKMNNQIERLTIFCKLIIQRVLLNTEEIRANTLMPLKSEINDGMPERFESEIGFYKSFIEYADFGFKTVIPNLKKKEKIYYHFIVATNLIKSSNNHPNERDAATWFAVDQSKKWHDEKLEKYGR